MPLTCEERDTLRLCAAVLGHSVQELRTRIVTGFLACARDPQRAECFDPWDGRLGPTVISEEDRRILTVAFGAPSYEDAVDTAVSMWLAEMAEQVGNAADQAAWEEFIGGDDDWWP